MSDATIGVFDGAPRLWSVHERELLHTADEAPLAVRHVIGRLRLSDAAAIVLTGGGAAAVLASMRGYSLAMDAAVALLAMLVAVPLWLAALSMARAYEPRYLFSGSAEIHRVGIAGAAMALTVVAAGWLVLDKDDAPVILGALALALVLTLAGRWIIRMRAQQANRAGVARARVLVVGHGDELTRLIGRLRRNLYHGWVVVGSQNLDSDGDLGVVAGARAHGADIVLLAPSASAQLESVADLQRRLHDEGRDVALAPPLVEAIGPRLSVDAVCGLPVLRITPPELWGPRRLVKAVADRGAAAVALLLASPVLVLFALAIRLDSKGPVFFRQRRVGRDGRLFTLWKFRTMYVDAEARREAYEAANEGAGPLFKMRRDPRVTRVGQWLRKSSLDELPQLLNVLAGTMSFVGPRPALPGEVSEYDEVMRRRLAVRPGITGLWQISGRSDLSWEETRRLDVRYVENWSLGFDMSILSRTVDAVIRARGAY